MNNERDFVHERFQIVKQQLENSALKMEPPQRARLEVEYRLLMRLNNEIDEGQILVTLEYWRQFLGEKLGDYLRYERPRLIREYYHYLYLPLDRRSSLPYHLWPEEYIAVVDGTGFKWKVDDRLLQLFDDMIKRLKRWLSEEE